MSEPLIQALENRIEHGETKADLKTEVLSVGHSEAVFEAAYREAAVRVAERQAEEAAQEGAEEARERTAATVQSAPASRPARATDSGHTLHVSAPALIGVRAMLMQGWTLATGSAGVLGAAVVAVIIGVLGLGVLVTVLGGATLGVASTVGTALFAIFFICVYVLAILFGLMLRYAVTRTLLQRRLGKSLWSNLGWGVTSLGSIFVLLFYLQTLTMTGFIFFLVPGVVAAVYFSQSTFVFAGENKRGSDVLVRSIELVHGHFWSVLVRYVAVFGIMVLISVVGSVITGMVPLFALVLFPVQLFAAWWMICVGVVLFESLQHLYPGSRFTSELRDRLKLWIRVVATIAVLVLLLALAALMNVVMRSDDLYEKILNPEITVPGNLTVPEVEIPNITDRQDTRAAAVKQNLSTIRSQAELYWSENLSYAGVCAEPLGAYDLISRTYNLGIGDVHCADDRDWYLVEAELPDGTYYCVDSSASAEVVPESRKGQQTCF